MFITYILLLGLVNANFEVSDDNDNNNIVNVYNTNNCSLEFTINYNEDSNSYISNIMSINNDGHTTATIKLNNDNYIYRFMYNKYDSGDEYIYYTFTYLNIYKNESLVGITIVSNNNITVMTANNDVLYYISQNYPDSKCKLPNSFSYYGITINNTIIPENIMATGIGIILPIVHSDYNLNKILMGILYFVISLAGLALVCGGMLCIYDSCCKKHRKIHPKPEDTKSLKENKNIQEDIELPPYIENQNSINPPRTAYKENVLTTDTSISIISAPSFSYVEDENNNKKSE